MRIGVPNEVKISEGRVGVTPDGVRRLVDEGHDVVVEAIAGVDSGFTADHYAAAGATITEDPAQAWDAELVVKVKEPVESEYQYLRDGLTLFTYLHLAADRPLADRLLESGTTSIAYETVTASDGSLPLLSPMSQIAGRMSIMVGGNLLNASHGGNGTLLASVPGSPPAKVVVLGGGVAGSAAASAAAGLGAEVVVVDSVARKLTALETMFPGQMRGVLSAPEAIAEELTTADLVIGTVLIPGAATPQLVDHEMVVNMPWGSALVDVAIDQGGCFVDSHPTTHADPTFVVSDSIFYCVGNMPGAYPRTSTYALSNATLPYVSLIATRGWQDAARDHAGLATGVTTHGGSMICPQVAGTFGMEPVPLEDALS